MENENVERDVVDPLAADIFTAMFKQSEDTTNRVFDNYDNVIKAWKSAYADLWDTVQHINAKVDSSRIERVLYNTEYARISADDDSVWSRP